MGGIFFKLADKNIMAWSHGNLKKVSNIRMMEQFYGKGEGADIGHNVLWTNKIKMRTTIGRNDEVQLNLMVIGQMIILLLKVFFFP